MIHIIQTSRLTGKQHAMNLPITLHQLAEWRQGALIQDVMPHLSNNEREFLMTGIPPEEWAAAFPPEDDKESPLTA